MNTTPTTIQIDAADAIEIVEAVEWLTEWFAYDPDLRVSMRRFSFGLSTLDEIASDLRLFAYRLGGES